MSVLRGVSPRATSVGDRDQRIKWGDGREQAGLIFILYTQGNDEIPLCIRSGMARKQHFLAEMRNARWSCLQFDSRDTHWYESVQIVRLASCVHPSWLPVSGNEGPLKPNFVVSISLEDLDRCKQKENSMRIDPCWDNNTPSCMIERWYVILL